MDKEKHRCKLCYRSFVNGNALGGHMRSHMMSLRVPPKTEELSNQLGKEPESTQSFSSLDFSEEEEEKNGDKGFLIHGPRENPKKSIRFVGPEISAAAGGPCSVVLQDKESETESFKNHRRRSKRVQRSRVLLNQFHDNNHDALANKVSEFETEPVSSISETTPDDDVAYCLMMLSRDKWSSQKIEEQEDQENEEMVKNLQYSDDEDDDDFDESDVIKVSKSTNSKVRGKYRCETCNRLFKSYQALGGHRASHKKIKLMNTREPLMADMENNSNNAGGSAKVEEKIHECPVCYRVFSSGQALGGHKRSHVMGVSVANNHNSASGSASGSASTSTNEGRGFGRNGETPLLDLNLPAPNDDDDYDDHEHELIEHSAVSDVEFAHPIRR